MPASLDLQELLEEDESAEEYHETADESDLSSVQRLLAAVAVSDSSVLPNSNTLNSDSGILPVLQQFREALQPAGNGPAPTGGSGPTCTAAGATQLFVPPPPPPPPKEPKHRSSEASVYEVVSSTAMDAARRSGAQSSSLSPPLIHGSAKVPGRSSGNLPSRVPSRVGMDTATPTKMYPPQDDPLSNSVKLLIRRHSGGGVKVYQDLHDQFPSGTRVEEDVLSELENTPSIESQQSTQLSQGFLRCATPMNYSNLLGRSTPNMDSDVGHRFNEQGLEGLKKGPPGNPSDWSRSPTGRHYVDEWRSRKCGVEEIDDGAPSTSASSPPQPDHSSSPASRGRESGRHSPWASRRPPKRGDHEAHPNTGSGSSSAVQAEGAGPPRTGHIPQRPHPPRTPTPGSASDSTLRSTPGSSQPIHLDHTTKPAAPIESGNGIQGLPAHDQELLRDRPPPRGGSSATEEGTPPPADAIAGRSSSSSADVEDASGPRPTGLTPAAGAAMIAAAGTPHRWSLDSSVAHSHPHGEPSDASTPSSPSSAPAPDPASPAPTASAQPKRTLPPSVSSSSTHMQGPAPTDTPLAASPAPRQKEVTPAPSTSTVSLDLLVKETPSSGLEPAPPPGAAVTDGAGSVRASRSISSRSRTEAEVAAAQSSHGVTAASATRQEDGRAPSRASATSGSTRGGAGPPPASPQHSSSRRSSLSHSHTTPHVAATKPPQETAATNPPTTGHRRSTQKNRSEEPGEDLSRAAAQQEQSVANNSQRSGSTPGPAQPPEAAAPHPNPDNISRAGMAEKAEDHRKDQRSNDEGADHGTGMDQPQPLDKRVHSNNKAKQAKAFPASSSYSATLLPSPPSRNSSSSNSSCASAHNDPPREPNTVPATKRSSNTESSPPIPHTDRPPRHHAGSFTAPSSRLPSPREPHKPLALDEEPKPTPLEVETRAHELQRRVGRLARDAKQMLDADTSASDHQLDQMRRSVQNVLQDLEDVEHDAREADRSVSSSSDLSSAAEIQTRENFDALQRLVEDVMRESHSHRKRRAEDPRSRAAAHADTVGRKGDERRDAASPSRGEQISAGAADDRGRRCSTPSEGRPDGRDLHHPSPSAGADGKFGAHADHRQQRDDSAGVHHSEAGDGWRDPRHVGFAEMGHRHPVEGEEGRQRVAGGVGKQGGSRRRRSTHAPDAVSHNVAEAHGGGSGRRTNGYPFLTPPPAPLDTAYPAGCPPAVSYPMPAVAAPAFYTPREAPPGCWHPGGAEPCAVAAGWPAFLCPALLLDASFTCTAADVALVASCAAPATLEPQCEEAGRSRRDAAQDPIIEEKAVRRRGSVSVSRATSPLKRLAEVSTEETALSSEQLGRLRTFLSAAPLPQMLPLASPGIHEMRASEWLRRQTGDDVLLLQEQVKQLRKAIEEEAREQPRARAFPPLPVAPPTTPGPSLLELLQRLLAGTSTPLQRPSAAPSEAAGEVRAGAGGEKREEAAAVLGHQQAREDRQRLWDMLQEIREELQLAQKQSQEGWQRLRSQMEEERAAHREELRQRIAAQAAEEVVMPLTDDPSTTSSPDGCPAPSSFLVKDPSSPPLPSDRGTAPLPAGEKQNTTRSTPIRLLPPTADVPSAAPLVVPSVSRSSLPPLPVSACYFKEEFIEPTKAPDSSAADSGGMMEPSGAQPPLFNPHPSTPMIIAQQQPEYVFRGEAKAPVLPLAPPSYQSLPPLAPSAPSPLSTPAPQHLALHPQPVPHPVASSFRPASVPSGCSSSGSSSHTGKESSGASPAHSCGSSARPASRTKRAGHKENPQRCSTQNSRPSSKRNSQKSIDQWDELQELRQKVDAVSGRVDVVEDALRQAPVPQSERLEMSSKEKAEPKHGIKGETRSRVGKTKKVEEDGKEVEERPQKVCICPVSSASAGSLHASPSLMDSAPFGHVRHSLQEDHSKPSAAISSRTSSCSSHHDRSRSPYTLGASRTSVNLRGGSPTPPSSAREALQALEDIKRCLQDISSKNQPKCEKEEQRRSSVTNEVQRKMEVVRASMSSSPSEPGKLRVELKKIQDLLAGLVSNSPSSGGAEEALQPILEMEKHRCTPRCTGSPKGASTAHSLGLGEWQGGGTRQQKSLPAASRISHRGSGPLEPLTDLHPEPVVHSGDQRYTGSLQQLPATSTFHFHLVDASTSPLQSLPLPGPEVPRRAQPQQALGLGASRSPTSNETSGESAQGLDFSAEGGHFGPTGDAPIPGGTAATHLHTLHNESDVEAALRQLTELEARKLHLQQLEKNQQQLLSAAQSRERESAHAERLSVLEELRALERVKRCEAAAAEEAKRVLNRMRDERAAAMREGERRRENATRRAEQRIRELQLSIEEAAKNLELHKRATDGRLREKQAAYDALVQEGDRIQQRLREKKAYALQQRETIRREIAVQREVEMGPIVDHMRRIQEEIAECCSRISSTQEEARGMHIRVEEDVAREERPHVEELQRAQLRLHSCRTSLRRLPNEFEAEQHRLEEAHQLEQQTLIAEMRRLQEELRVVKDAEAVEMTSYDPRSGRVAVKEASADHLFNLTAVQLPKSARGYTAQSIHEELLRKQQVLDSRRQQYRDELRQLQLHYAHKVETAEASCAALRREETDSQQRLAEVRRRCRRRGMEEEARLGGLLSELERRVEGLRAQLAERQEQLDRLLRRYKAADAEQLQLERKESEEMAEEEHRAKCRTANLLDAVLADAKRVEEDGRRQVAADRDSLRRKENDQRRTQEDLLKDLCRIDAAVDEDVERTRAGEVGAQLDLANAEHRLEAAQVALAQCRERLRSLEQKLKENQRLEEELLQERVAQQTSKSIELREAQQRDMAQLATAAGIRERDYVRIMEEDARAQRTAAAAAEAQPPPLTTSHPLPPIGSGLPAPSLASSHPLLPGEWRGPDTLHAGLSETPRVDAALPRVVRMESLPVAATHGVPQPSLTAKEQEMQRQTSCLSSAIPSLQFSEMIGRVESSSLGCIPSVPHERQHIEHAVSGGRQVPCASPLHPPRLVREGEADHAPGRAESAYGYQINTSPAPSMAAAPVARPVDTISDVNIPGLERLESQSMHHPSSPAANEKSISSQSPLPGQSRRRDVPGQQHVAHCMESAALANEQSGASACDAEAQLQESPVSPPGIIPRVRRQPSQSLVRDKAEYGYKTNDGLRSDVLASRSSAVMRSPVYSRADSHSIFKASSSSHMSTVNNSHWTEDEFSTRREGSMPSGRSCRAAAQHGDEVGMSGLRVQVATLPKEWAVRAGTPDENGPSSVCSVPPQLLQSGGSSPRPRTPITAAALSVALVPEEAQNPPPVSMYMNVYPHASGETTSVGTSTAAIARPAGAEEPRESNTGSLVNSEGVIWVFPPLEPLQPPQESATAAVDDPVWVPSPVRDSSGSD